jgi:hypothetical protein
LIDELYKLIGQRDAELAWLKKKLSPFNPCWQSRIDWQE